MEQLAPYSFEKFQKDRWQEDGIKGNIHIPNVLLRLNHIVRTMTDDVNTFHTQERSLYEPLRMEFQKTMPFNRVVDIESGLHELDNPKQRTDISIRHPKEFEKDRLDKSLRSWCFIEIKSVLFGERLEHAKIVADIRKLLECESNYQAKCFFALVGLSSELAHSKKSMISLGIPSNSQHAFKFSLDDKEEAWLMPSGRHDVTEPKVYTWAVSKHEKFKTGYTGCSFCSFQSLD